MLTTQDCFWLSVILFGPFTVLMVLAVWRKW